MSQRLLFVLLSSLLLSTPALAQDDQDEEEGADLDSLMSDDPERKPAPKPEAADDGGDGDETSDDVPLEPGSMTDEERPPVDEDAFVKPKQEGPAETVSDTDVGRPVSLGLLVGYGFNLDGPTNAWGFGLGARGGYDLGLVSLGLRFAYFLGESGTESVPGFGSQLAVVDTTRTFWELSFDAGLDLDAGKAITIRPGLGIGLASLTIGDTSNVAPSIAPALMLIYKASDAFYLSFEARYQVIAAETSASGFALNAGFGLMF